MVHKNPTEREYLDKKQLADYFGMSERTINYFLKKGLPHFRVGRKTLRFKRTEAEKWFEQFRVDEANAVDRLVEEVIGQ
jgi:predicted DNA-binding transcriptional regulator AlpA